MSARDYLMLLFITGYTIADTPVSLKTKAVLLRGILLEIATLFNSVICGKNKQ